MSIFKDLLRGRQRDIESAVSGAYEPGRPEQSVSRANQGRDNTEDDIDRLAAEERSRQFRELFDPRSGRFEPPFFIRRPDSRSKRLKRYDTRPTPVGSRIEDTQRLGNFLTSPRGVLFLSQEAFRQSQNPQKGTRIFDPSSYLASATGVSQFADKDSRLKRHFDRSGSLIGRGLDALGVNDDILGGSSNYEDIVAEDTGDVDGIPWGYFVSPAPRQSADKRDQIVPSTPSRRNLLRRLGEQISSIAAGYGGRFGRAKRAADVISAQLGVNDSVPYLGTVRYRVPATRDSRRNDSDEIRDVYSPERPYVQDVAVNEVVLSSNPTGSPLASQPLISVAQEVYDGRRDIFTTSITLDRAFETYREVVNRNDGSFPFPDYDNLKSNRRDTASDPGDSNPLLFYENLSASKGLIPITRGGGGSVISYGTPNYSQDKPTDLLQTVGVYSEEFDTEEYEYDSTEETFKDFIPFKFYDVANGNVLVFRAMITGISETVNSSFDEISYSGRPDKAYNYSGATSQLTFSFRVYPMSVPEFEVQWEKLNYLKGLNYPSRFLPARGGGSYMSPPLLRLTIGDMYRKRPGFFNSFTLNIDEQSTWELDEDIGRLPRLIDINVGYTFIENDIPFTGQRFYDAPFIPRATEDQAAIRASFSSDETISGDIDQALEEQRRADEEAAQARGQERADARANAFSDKRFPELQRIVRQRNIDAQRQEGPGVVRETRRAAGGILN